MVQSLYYSSRLPLQKTVHHSAQSFEPLQSEQCILVTGPLLVTSPLSGTSRPQASYMTTLLHEIVEWCVSNEVITQPARVEEWRTLVKENTLLRLIYSIGEYLPNQSDFQRCLNDIFFHLTPIQGFYQFFTTHAFRGYITTTYDAFIEEAYYAHWQKELPKLSLTSSLDPTSAPERPFIFKPYGDKGTLELAVLRQRLTRKAMTREVNEQLQQLVEDRPVLFLGFDPTDPELHMFWDLLGQREIFFSPFLDGEGTELLTRRIVVSSQFSEQTASANVSSSSLSPAALLPQTQTDPSPPQPARIIEIFISYDDNDEKLLKELQEHLTVMQRQYYEQKHYEIKIWHTGRLIAGQDWQQEIQEQLVKAHIILLLVSVQFLNSELYHDIQIESALQRHIAKEAYFIPVILHPCNWIHEKFGRLHPLPKRGKPVIEWRPRNKAYVNIIEGIREAIDAFPFEERRASGQGNTV